MSDRSKVEKEIEFWKRELELSMKGYYDENGGKSESEGNLYRNAMRVIYRK